MTGVHVGRSHAIAALGAAVGVCALSVDLSAIDGSLTSLDAAVGGTGAEWLVVFAALLLFGGRALAAVAARRRERIAALVCASVLGAAQVVGRSLDHRFDLSDITGSAANAAAAVVTYAGFVWLFFCACALIFGHNARRAESARHSQGVAGATKAATRWSRVDAWIGDRGVRAAATAFAVIVVARVPYVLWLYPGVVTYDSARQMGQALGRLPLTNHHPIVHTLLIGLFVRPADALGHLTAGVAAFAIAQVLVTSAVAVVVLWRLRVWGARAPVLAGVLAVLALYPVHSAYAMTLWKDVAFGWAVLLYVTLMVDLLRSPRTMLASRRWITAFVVTSLGVYVLRNNGPYVLVGGGLALAIALLHHWRRLLPVVVVPLVVGALTVSGIMAATGATPGPVREALSIPLQQIARVSSEHADQLTPHQREFVTDLFAGKTPEEVGEAFVPWISNPVKNKVDGHFLETRRGEFVAGWLGLARSYPGDFATQLLAGGYGYWYPGAEYWVASTSISSEAEGLEPRGSFGPTFLLNVRGVPVVSVFWSIGFHTWIAAVAFTAMALRGRRRLVILAAPLGTLWLTCLASPVFGEFRYLYGLVLAVPLLLALAFGDLDDVDDGDRDLPEDDLVVEAPAAL